MNIPPQSRSCPSCGLTEGAGYGGTPACQGAWGGALPRPIPAGCILYASRSENLAQEPSPALGALISFLDTCDEKDNVTIPGKRAKALAAELLAMLNAPASSERAQLLEDALDDVKRLHAEKMKFFERTIELERQLAAVSATSPAVSAPPGVTVTVSYGPEQWFAARVTSLDSLGLGFVEATGRQFPFTFDRIDGYRGEYAKEIGLRVGATVYVLVKDEKIERLSLRQPEGGGANG